LQRGLLDFVHHHTAVRGIGVHLNLGVTYLSLFQQEQVIAATYLFTHNDALFAIFGSIPRKGIGYNTKS
jgi:hypothetical protein